MKKKNVSTIMNIMILILVIIMIIYLIVSFISMRFIWSQTNKVLSITMQQYIEKADRNFEEIDSILKKLAISDKEVAIYALGSEDDMSLYRSMINIVDALKRIQIIYGEEYLSFVYFEKKEEFLLSDRGNVALKDWKLLNQKVLEEVKHSDYNINNATNEQWNTIQIEAAYYAVKTYHYNEIYVCSYVKINDLANKIEDIDLDTKYAIQFIKDNLVLNEKVMKEQKNTTEDFFNGIGQKKLYLPMEYGDFDIYILIQNQVDILNALFIQIAIIILFLVASICSIYSYYVAKKRVVEPIKFFSENLERLQKENEKEYFRNSNIQELDEANKLFEKVFQQVKSLKIEIYEKEIEQHKIKLDYMQLQIQPHFYINCLGIIRNMAYYGDFEGIQQMSEIISNYIRYNFRPNNIGVLLTQELEHIQNYFAICRIRYGDNYKYNLTVKGDMEGIVIPPLILQTFVENCVKYSNVPEKSVTIAIEVEKISDQSQESVMIIIKDTGKGFQPEILEKLQKGIPIIEEDGKKIGINNVIMRLKLIYQEDAEIAFYNDETGGAVVKIGIPAKYPKKIGGATNEYTISG